MRHWSTVFGLILAWETSMYNYHLHIPYCCHAMMPCLCSAPTQECSFIRIQLNLSPLLKIILSMSSETNPEFGPLCFVAYQLWWTQIGHNHRKWMPLPHGSTKDSLQISLSALSALLWHPCQCMGRLSALTDPPYPPLDTAEICRCLIPVVISALHHCFWISAVWTVDFMVITLWSPIS